MSTTPDQQLSEARVLRDEAVYAALLGYPGTKAAKRLVDAVYARVAEDQRHHAKGQAHEKSLRKAVSAFVADLLVARSRDRSGWVYRSMSPRNFTGAPVGATVFIERLVPALQRLGFIDRRNSVTHYSARPGSDKKSERGRQWATRFRAQQALLDLSNHYGVAPQKADEHFEFKYTLPREPLQKRTASTAPEYGGQKLRGRKMSFTHTAQSQMLQSEVEELNDYLARQRIVGGLHGGYIRIFQNGDQDGFHWNFGGRLYSTPPQKNYQQLSKRDQKRKGEKRRTPGRLKMTINGEAVAEVDIRASYLTILHALHGQQLPLDRDLYSLPGLGKKGRHAVKMWFVATLGSGKLITRWPTKLIADYEAESGKPFDRRAYSVKRIGGAAVKQYPLIARLEEPLHGRVRGWPDFMFLESCAMVGAMLALKRDHDVPTLAVHDSLIVPASKSALAIQVLKSQFTEVTGKEAQVILSQ